MDYNIIFYTLDNNYWETEDGRFFLHKEKTIFYLTDRIEYKVRVFLYFIDLCDWFQEVWNYILKFKQQIELHRLGVGVSGTSSHTPKSL